ncbi:hypothetical protein CALCODRAFT_472224 [Calocera cornea HHB12733]|uniref:Peptide hydrolase n=1 Tax=Calocera cornea HHB12733 TaxID=1353952 RepID=A0A165ET53_9BASI|nr:hypothetical protein CALCODRAFT_472224 [Calocera cornea HHB12733]
MQITPYFRFGLGPVTFLITITYIAIFAATVGIHEYGWDAPEKGSGERMGLDLEGAMDDLRVIARRPHPYNSKENDVVHDHILSRVNAMAVGKSFIEVDDDMISNTTFVNGGVLGDLASTHMGNVMYFEGTNILVKVEGERPGLPAVLLSAHYDSVSTAPGATDNGMGVTSLLALISHYSTHRPPRTLIFNINNAEEDGLLGAWAFLSHPWSALPKTFLNLEGAGQAGRPVLFRTSSPHVTSAYHGVPHPHGNSISADAFKQKLVRSNTDYVVYATKGWEGLDLAFYRGRSRYHTRADSVPGVEGTRAQWAMLESAYWATEGLMADEGANEGGETVYFDVLGSAIAVFSLQTVYIINILFLILGPMIVGGMLWFTHVRRRVAFPLRGWVRFPVALVVSFGGTMALAFIYNKANPYIVHSSSYVVLISFLCTAFVLLTVTLRLFANLRPVHEQKLIVLIELYIFWWFLLAISTGFEGAPQYLVGPYFVTLFNAGTFFALLLGLGEDALLEWRGSNEKERIVSVPGEEEGDPDVEDRARDVSQSLPAEPTERTPLVPREQPVDPVHEGERQIFALWMFQFWLAVVFPAIWTCQTVLLLMTALGQTLVDGSAPITVYLGMAFFGYLIVLPLAPFLHAMHFNSTLTLALLLLGSGIWCLAAAPFTPSFPFKTFYRQVVTLDSNPVRNEVMLGGIPSVIPATVTSWKPSAEVECGSSLDVMFRPNLVACVWEGHAGAEGMGVDFRVTRTSSGTAKLEVTGSNTRSCGVQFDKPVHSLRIADAAAPSSTPDKVDQVALMSRTWNKTFELEFDFDQEMQGGTVYCEYADARPGQIPDFDDVMESIPVWATVTKGSSGLVIARKSWKVPGLEEGD